MNREKRSEHYRLATHRDHNAWADNIRSMLSWFHEHSEDELDDYWQGVVGDLLQTEGQRVPEDRQVWLGSNYETYNVPLVADMFSLIEAHEVRVSDICFPDWMFINLIHDRSMGLTNVFDPNENEAPMLWGARVHMAKDIPLCVFGEENYGPDDAGGRMCVVAMNTLPNTIFRQDSIEVDYEANDAWIDWISSNRVEASEVIQAPILWEPLVKLVRQHRDKTFYTAFFNARDYADLRKFGRDRLEINSKKDQLIRGYQGRLEGKVPMITSRQVPVGMVYFVTSHEPSADNIIALGVRR